MFCFCGKKSKKKTTAKEHANAKQIDTILSNMKAANSGIKTISLISPEGDIISNLTDMDFQ